MKGRIKKTVLALCLSLITAMGAASASPKIVYVPLDNRPVNLYQVAQVAESLDYEIATPPEEWLGSWDRPGEPEKLWKWVETEIHDAKATVLSTDALIYGSLVNSRKHDLDSATIMARAENFQKLHNERPNLPMYAFGTVMRTPTYKTYNDASYLTTHGLAIFRYTAIKDKEEMGNKTVTKNLDKVVQICTAV